MTTKRTPTPYHVRAYPGDLLGKFVDSTDALRVAQMWSSRWGSWAEVHCVTQGDDGGIIGQFDKGEPTPKFEHIRPIL
jgi:hypothetical protein